MQRRSGRELADAREKWLIDIALSNASDEQLLTEVRRRGFRVSGARKTSQRVDPAEREVL
jgi:hypothetical protein